MKRLFALLTFFLLFGSVIFAQEKETKEINYTSERTSKDENKYPGALIMYKIDNQVTFTHEGIKVWCDQAIFYQEENFFRASGNVEMIQGDTIHMTSGYVEYDGVTEFAFASNNVLLKTPTAELATDTLFFDRNRQQAFYRSGGTVKDAESTITSRVGRYYMDHKKFTFLNRVVVTNEEYKINSNHLDFYEETGEAYLYGPSTITGDNNEILFERGFYDTRKDYGYFVKNAQIFYDNRQIEGDSLFFDRPKNFASATNNIKVIDTVNQSVVRGHYAEVFQDKDSVFITKKALISKRQDQDTLHIHSDTIMVTGKPDNRIIRAYYNARFLKEDMNGRANIITMDEKKGVTHFLQKPVIFSDLIQMTGDTIKLFNNPTTNKLDSLSVNDNAFLIQKDTIDGYNQVKGKIMYGLFDEDNKLQEANFIKNTETIYYWRNDKDGELIGINKAISSRIRIEFEDSEVRSVEYLDNPENSTLMPKNFPENVRKLRGFNWRGDERILNKADLFEGDPPLDLPKIKGIPLPDDKSFFSEPTGKRPIINEKSRLKPKDLENRESDNPQNPSEQEEQL